MCACLARVPPLLICSNMACAAATVVVIAGAVAGVLVIACAPAAADVDAGLLAAGGLRPLAVSLDESELE